MITRGKLGADDPGDGASAEKLPWLGGRHSAEPARTQQTQTPPPVHWDPTPVTPATPVAPAEPEPVAVTEPEPEPLAEPEPQAPAYDRFAEAAPAEPEPAPVREEPVEEPRPVHVVSESVAERRADVPTPRRRVVFEEPDDLDIPDFLK